MGGAAQNKSTSIIYGNRRRASTGIQKISWQVPGTYETGSLEMSTLVVKTNLLPSFLTLLHLTVVVAPCTAPLQQNQQFEKRPVLSRRSLTCTSCRMLQRPYVTHRDVALLVSTGNPVNQYHGSPTLRRDASSCSIFLFRKPTFLIHQIQRKSIEQSVRTLVHELTSVSWLNCRVLHFPATRYRSQQNLPRTCQMKQATCQKEQICRPE
jgi:hypothetical protein